MVTLNGIRPEVDGEFSFDSKQVTPFHGPIVGKFLPLEQTIYQPSSFIRIAIQQEFPGFLGGWQSADDVKEDATDKDRVGTGVGRLNAQLLETVEDPIIDRASSRRWAGQFKWAYCGRMGSRETKEKTEPESYPQPPALPVLTSSGHRES
jgi:hypothetical protein